MPDYSIFYSWQSDTPNEVNRGLIRNALNQAISEIKDQQEIVDSPRVESGMEGISGTPEVASVMFDKIRESSMLVADMTLIGTSDHDKEKRIANPNVTLELGYAAGVLGWDRVICVMNEHFGDRTEQAFDVRNRRFPIDYTLDPNRVNEDGERVKKDLTKWLKAAITTAEKNDLMKVDLALKRIDLPSLRLIYAYHHSEYFSEPMPFECAYKVYRDLFPPAIPRLLDLGLIWSDQNGPKGLYAYHWTYLGRKVIERLKPRLI